MSVIPAAVVVFVAMRFAIWVGYRRNPLFRAVQSLEALAGFIARLVSVGRGLATLRSYIVLRPIG